MTLWRPFGEAGPSWAELTRQALSSTVEGYDRLAPRFDATPFRTPDAILARALVDQRRHLAGGAAIDLCCGTGAALRHLEGSGPERLVGLDLSAGMLTEARERLGPGPELMRGDALAPPPALHGAFDLATCFGAFGHIPEADEPRFVDAVRQVLRPGGRFVFVTGEGPAAGSRPRLGRAVAHAFNGAMRVRNALWKPEFVMYYLTFELPRASALLQDRGFEVTVDRGLFEPPFERLVRVVATRPGS